MRKVVIFGRTGLLGSAIYDQIFGKFDVYAPPSSEVDLTDFDAVGLYLNKIKPDIVINCTGYNDVEGAEDELNFERAQMMNTKVPGLLAKLSDSIGYKFMQFSTDYVFNGDQNGYNEDDTPDPINNYGETKFRGEQEVKKCNKHFIIRISWLFGEGGKNFVTTMLKLASERDELSIVNDQIGKPTYAHDVAGAVVDLFDSEDYGTYHLPNEDSLSWFDFAKEIFEISGFTGRVKPVSSAEYVTKAKRPSNSILHNTKLPKLRSHQQALRDFLSKTL